MHARVTRCIKNRSCNANSWSAWRLACDEVTGPAAPRSALHVRPGERLLDSVDWLERGVQYNGKLILVELKRMTSSPLAPIAQDKIPATVVEATSAGISAAVDSNSAVLQVSFVNEKTGRGVASLQRCRIEMEVRTHGSRCSRLQQRTLVQQSCTQVVRPACKFEHYDTAITTNHT